MRFAKVSKYVEPDRIDVQVGHKKLQHGFQKWRISAQRWLWWLMAVIDADIPQNDEELNLEINLSKIWSSSHRRCSVRKGVLRNFTKFTEKHLCQSHFFNKVAGCEISNSTFFTEHLWWLLLAKHILKMSK